MRLQNIFEKISDNFSSRSVSLPSTPESFLDIKFHASEDSLTKVNVQAEVPLPFAKTNLFKVPIIDAKKLVNDERSKKVIELILNISNVPVSFTPGDTVSILPENADDEIDLVIESLNLNEFADKPCQIILKQPVKKKTARIPIFIPQISTPRKILKESLNIRSTPKKLLLRTLVNYTSDDQEKKLLEILCSKEGSELYSKCITENEITFLDILKLCPTCCPPFSVLLEHLPRLLPRPYSIASSPLYSNNEIKIIFSIFDNNKHGLTTKMLEKLTEEFLNQKNTEHFLNLYFRESNQFKYTDEDLSKNQILIGVGCAISPFIGFLEHKASLLKAEKLKNAGKTWLFTGSRYKDNALYRQEFMEYLRMGILDELYESFSRENPSTYKYVQNQIEANSNNFVKFLLNENTILYICADGTKISQNIQQCVMSCIKSVMEISEEDAMDMIKNFKKKSKYIEDIWI